MSSGVAEPRRESQSEMESRPTCLGDDSGEHGLRSIRTGTAAQGILRSAGCDPWRNSGRWPDLPEPHLPLSGRSPSEILSKSTKEQIIAALETMSKIAKSSPQTRDQLISDLIGRRQLTEADVWISSVMAQQVRFRSTAEAAVILEAWLQWSERLGRKDALLWAAGDALSLLIVQRGALNVRGQIDRWSGLEAPQAASLGLARLSMVRARFFYVTGDHDHALKTYRSARKRFMAGNDLPGQANAWRGEAEVLSRLGDRQGALASFRAARQVLMSLGDRLGQANTWLGEADAVLVIGRSDSALDAYRRARTLYQEVGDSLGLGNTWKGEGDVLFRKGELDEALAAYRRAQILFEAMGSHNGRSGALQGEARILVLKGELDAALTVLREARMLAQSNGSQLDQANCLHDEAGILFRLGDSKGALRGHRKARKLYQNINAPLGQANTWRAEADILEILGHERDALIAYRQARALFKRVDDPLGQGNSWNGEAGVLLEEKQHAPALVACHEGRKLFEAAEDPLGQGHTWNTEAQILLETRNDDRALAASRKAYRFYESASSRLGQANASILEAEALMGVGRPAAAVEAARQAAELAASQSARSNEMRALNVEMHAHHQLGAWNRVVRLAERIIQHNEKWRSGFFTDQQRTDQEDVIGGVFALLIPALWRINQPLEALERAEEARSRVLLDLMTARSRNSSSQRGDSSPDSMLRREGILSELAQVTRELATEPPADRQRQLHQDRAILDDALERLAFESLLSAEEPFVSATSLDLQAMRSLVHETGPVLLFQAALDETFVYLLRPGFEIFAESLKLPREELHERVTSLAEKLANPNYENQAQQDLATLWADLVGPVSELLPTGGPLTLIPHGPLHQVPFAALIDPQKRFMFERHDLAVVPSFSILERVRARHRHRKDDDSLLALTAGGGRNTGVDESHGVVGLFDPSHTLRLGPGEVFYRTYVEHAPAARQILISSQAVLDRGRRRLTFLEIDASERHDHRLSAAEIATIPLDAELVTLAACDTAAATALFSDERLDLSRAFLAAGAGAVLATHWKLPEGYRTSRFLTDFYSAYRRGGPEGKGMRKDQALTQARRLSRERGDPSRIWAAWILIGDAR